jgi:hypothetical protein
MDLDVMLVLNSFDNVTGVKEIRYALNGDAGTVFGASTSLLFTTDGNKTISFHAVDNSDNAESPKSVSFKIDKIAPVISVNSPKSENYFNNRSIFLDFSATDALSGIASVVATLDGNPVTSGNNINLLSLIGSHTLIVTTIDQAGNENSAAVRFDVLPAQLPGLSIWGKFILVFMIGGLMFWVIRRKQIRS